MISYTKRNHCFNVLDIEGFCKNWKYKALLRTGNFLLNPRSYVKICFAFLLFINTIFFLEIKSAIHIFLQKDFIEIYFIVPSILFQQNTGTKHCRTNIGQERDSKQYTAGCCSLLACYIDCDSWCKCCWWKRLASLLKWTVLVYCFKLFKTTIYPGR